MQPFNWQCPYCNMMQSVTKVRFSAGIISLDIVDQAEGQIALEAAAIGCANPHCLRTQVHAMIGNAYFDYSGLVQFTNKEPLFSAYLLPQGTARPQPDFIPKAIREDYHEACLIRDLSPKASATLIRRCLQGMIRDFTGISKGRLIDEINALRIALDDGSANRAVTPESVEAIDHVRNIGNIGAHMEKDIDLIVPVDPGEAQALIDLVELLFEEWYGAREARRVKLAQIASMSAEKAALKSALQDQKALPAPDAREESA